MVRGSTEYGLRESECHGLKEIVGLLALLYDEDSDCLIIDEPELHLHPQYQAFVLDEIRAAAGNPSEKAGSKCFFLVTHSPYALDLRSLSDLANCLLFQPGRPPVCIEPDSLKIDHVRVRRAQAARVALLLLLEAILGLLRTTNMTPSKPRSESPFWTATAAPPITETITTSEVVPRMIPTSVRIERSLWLPDLGDRSAHRLPEVHYSYLSAWIGLRRAALMAG